MINAIFKHLLFVNPHKGTLIQSGVSDVTILRFLVDQTLNRDFIPEEATFTNQFSKGIIVI